MAKSNMMLTDEQWERIRPFIPARQKSAKGGRPPSDDRAQVLVGGTGIRGGFEDD